MVILPEYFHLRGIGRFLSRDILLGQTGVKKGAVQKVDKGQPYIIL